RSTWRTRQSGPYGCGSLVAGRKEPWQMFETKKATSADASLLSRRNFFIGAAMLATSGLAFARQPTVHNPVVKREVFEGWVPQQFGQWSMVASSGVVLPSPDALSDRLYDNLVTRVYGSPDAAVMMLL